MENMTEEIKRLKKEIETAKKEKSQSEGSLKTLIERLKKEFGLSDIEQINKRYQELKEKEVETKEKLERAFCELKEKFEW